MGSPSYDEDLRQLAQLCGRHDLDLHRWEPDHVFRFRLPGWRRNVRTPPSVMLRQLAVGGWLVTALRPKAGDVTMQCSNVKLEQIVYSLETAVEWASTWLRAQDTLSRFKSPA